MERWFIGSNAIIQDETQVLTVPESSDILEDMEEPIKFGFVSYITEDITGRTPHPEDSIFDGSAAAADAVRALGGVIANPSQITIKWDGYPALIFGRTPEGKIAIMDKYMFDKSIMATSPQEWQQYDASKSNPNTRADLYEKLAILYKGLEPVVKGEGFFWGDLLWTGKLNPVMGDYVFKPNTVEYHVPMRSALGGLISNSFGGIVVHQHFGELGGQPSEWNGQGLVTAPNAITIVKPGLGIKFRLKEPVQLARAASAAVEKYGQAVDDLFLNIPATTKAAIKTYFNKKITGQTNVDLHQWLSMVVETKKVSVKQFKILVGEDMSGSLFTTNSSGQVQESLGYIGLKAIWNSIYAYKLALCQQLESQVQGIEQYVNGAPGGEGFVFPTPLGLMKLVNRGQFSAALFAQQKG